MKQFIQHFADKITGTLSGWDRIVLRGTLRPIAFAAGMMVFLWEKQIRLQNFGRYVFEISQSVKVAACKAAEPAKRPVIFLRSGQIDKADLASQIARADDIQEGLIAVFKAVEPCIGYDVVGDREKKKLVLIQRPRKCLAVYHYSIDPEFGLTGAGIQTWFPFQIQICINGREWLSRQMDRAGIGYEKQENCFTWIEDIDAAQKLMNQQLRFAWQKKLSQIAGMLNPVHDSIFDVSKPIDYYWSTSATEWATDIMFSDPPFLSNFYRALTLHGIRSFSSADVLRFLGKRFRQGSNIEIVTDFKDRREGIRIKHRVGKNSVKAYDKYGLLRVETTINDAKAFRAFRRKENDPKSEMKWRYLRSGVSDMHRRAQISQACNDRYLDALASIDVSTSLGELFERICQPTIYDGKRIRALLPNSPDDLQLFKAINHGEFCISGFRNRDLQTLLFDDLPTSDLQKRRRSSRVTRLIRLLRAHHLIRKIPKTYRYLLTPLGREITAAVLASQRISLKQLNQIAA
jgi:hypothetical protein